MLPEVISDLRLSMLEAGMVLSVTSFFMMLLMAVASILADKIGLRITLLIGQVILAGSVLLSSTATSYLYLLACFAIIGVGASFFTPSLYSLIGKHLPVSRGLMLGITNSIYYLGMLAGPLATSILTVMFEWRVTFLSFGLIIAFSIFGSQCLLKNKGKNFLANRDFGERYELKIVASFLRSRNLLAILFANCFAVSVFG